MNTAVACCPQSHYTVINQMNHKEMMSYALATSTNCVSQRSDDNWVTVLITLATVNLRQKAFFMFITVVWRLKLLSTVSCYYWSLTREFNEERIFKICCLRLESDLASGWSPTTAAFFLLFTPYLLPSSSKTISCLFFVLLDEDSLHDPGDSFDCARKETC